MGIINATILTGTTTADDTKAKIDAAINNQLQVMLTTRQLCMSAIYGGGQDIEQSQAVLNAYGTDATKLFQISYSNDSAIETAAEAAGVEVSLSSPPFSYTLNEDGTVTLSPVSESSGE